MTQEQWDDAFGAVQQLSEICEGIEPDPESLEDLDFLLALGDHLIALALMLRHKRFETDLVEDESGLEVPVPRKSASH